MLMLDVTTFDLALTIGSLGIVSGTGPDLKLRAQLLLSLFLLHSILTMLLKNNK